MTSGFFIHGAKLFCNKKYDPGFGKIVVWDIPLLEGYNYEFLENTAADKGSHHFNGIINPYIIESINEYKPDAILVYGWSFKSHLKVMRHFKNKIPVLFRGDSTLLDKMGVLSSLKRNLFLRWVYRHIDIALYVGKNNYDYFRNAGVKKNKLVLAPHGIDNERFECIDSKRKKNDSNLLEKLQIPAGDFIFLFAGKLEVKKDPGILLKAFANANFNKDVHLVIVGNGELEKKLKKEYNLHANIHFHDFVNQSMMPALYEVATVFVLPSKGPGETWGLAVNEAMANGKVVIVSDKCGCSVDLVENGVNGYIFPAGNSNALKDILKLAYVAKKNFSEMAMQSKNKIKQYSFTILAEAVESTLIKA